MPQIPAVRELDVLTLSSGGSTERPDAVVVEEPLEIRLGERPVSVTLRTPGHDDELAVGFLYSEGIVRHTGDVRQVESLDDNVIRIDLDVAAAPDALARLERHFTMTSSCGLCGKTSLDTVRAVRPAAPPDPARIQAAAVHSLPGKLREAQPAFAGTGGLHAAALFDAAGMLLSLREDVGRHNAVDKLVGAELLAGRVPLSGRVLFLSGRAGFELVQKAYMANVPMIAAIGAPSTLAVELAREAGILLAGFVRDGRFNVYAGQERLEGEG